MEKINFAWHLFKSFHIKDSISLSLDAIKNHGAQIDSTPLIEAQVLSALHQNHLGNHKVSFDILIELLNLSTKKKLAQDALLYILKNNHTTYSAKWVFGLGTGRSGSSSLCRSLQDIKNSYFSHEHPSRIAWEDDDANFNFHLERLKALSSNYEIVGDVSHWWLMYVDDIVKHNQNSYFIAVKRDQEETVTSFLKVKGGNQKGAINHFIEHDGSYWKKNVWDVCYPKFQNSEDSYDALKKYWGHYYELCEKYAQKYPKNFLIVDMYELFTKNRLNSILNEKFNIKAEILSHYDLNKKTTLDGKNMVPFPSKLFE